MQSLGAGKSAGLLSSHNEAHRGRGPGHPAILGAMATPHLSPGDRVLAGLGQALRALTARPDATRPMPREPAPAVRGGITAATAAATLTDAERHASIALIRVDHVGEVCAQALYTAQALATADPALRRRFERCAAEETDHLAWTAERLRELGGRPSLLNPLWYAGSFAIGLAAGRAGDATSLGFVVETERQVEQHLASHLERLPEADRASRAVLRQMKDDEAEHALAAEQAGARRLPLPVRLAMRAAARVMTGTARYV